jgi:hypothetical protein
MESVAEKGKSWKFQTSSKSFSGVNSYWRNGFSTSCHRQSSAGLLKINLNRTRGLQIAISVSRSSNFSHTASGGASKTEVKVIFS